MVVTCIGDIRAKDKYAGGKVQETMYLFTPTGEVPVGIPSRTSGKHLEEVARAISRERPEIPVRVRNTQVDEIHLSEGPPRTVVRHRPLTPDEMTLLTKYMSE